MMHKIWFAALVVAAAVMTLMASNASAQLAGSKHDLTSTGGAQAAFKVLAAGDYMCKPCHAPHKANAAADIPLQNRANSTTTGTYTFFDTTHVPATANRATIDLVCLSCHDGVTAVDAWTGNGAGTSFMGSATAGNVTATPAYLDPSLLGGTHPTSITYSGTGEFFTLAAAKTNGLTFYGAGADQVKCASCHDVHRGGTSATNGFFLRLSAATLCAGCHNK